MTATKIGRDAFLYLEPKGKDGSQFAQCSTCMMFMPDEELCSIHGPKLKILSRDSCGFYVQGKPMHEGEAMALVTPAESGLVHREVRCENCQYLGNPQTTCLLYEKLNKLLPTKFWLDTKVKKQACCNAQTPKTETAKAQAQYTEKASKHALKRLMGGKQQ